MKPLKKLKDILTLKESDMPSHPDRIYGSKRFQTYILVGTITMFYILAGIIFGVSKGCNYTLQKIYPETFTEEGVKRVENRKKLRKDLFSKIAGEDKILESKDIRKFLDYLGDIETIVNKDTKLAIFDPFEVNVYERRPKGYRQTEQDSYFVKALTQEQVETYLKTH